MSLIYSTINLISVIGSAAVKYIRLGKYKSAYDPFITVTATDKECREMCNVLSSCNGYAVDISNDGCFLSSCDTFIDVLGCSTCLFAKKEVPLSVMLCSQSSTVPLSNTLTQGTTTSLSVTTEDRTTMPDTTNMTQFTTLKDSTSLMQYSIATSSLITKATNDTTAINDTTCVCVCKYVNQTLDESIERRRKELIINKTRLSSTIRKLTSAPDYRKSVEVIGTLAIVVLVVLGLFLFCSDVCSIMSFVWLKKCVHMNH